MNDSDISNPPAPDWVRHMRARGLSGVCLAALDALEPFTALGAQALLVAQPALGIFGWRDAAGGLVSALETPEGVDQLRRWLESDGEGDESGG